MKFIGLLGSIWGTIGVFALIGGAVVRLAPRAREAVDLGLSPAQWIIFGLVVVFMAYAEGYKGFQKKFSPRTAARIHYLFSNPNVIHTIFAPFFSMGYFHATRRTKIVAWSLSLGILALVLLVRLLDQPWRGIIDAGVVVGLTWGLISLVAFIVRAFARGEPDALPEVPATEETVENSGDAATDSA